VQADRSLARTSGGLGIGLSLVKGLLELHHGDIEARSEGPGTGAEFTLRLPIVATQPAASVTHAEAPAAGPRKRVLVIEDSVDSADSLNELLTLLGYEVRTAFDGPSGIQEAHRFRPDVILCDLGLPAMDGYSVARALRSDAETASVVLVAVTGYAEADDRRRALEAGFDEHVSKPPDLGTLEGALRRAPRRYLS
jgi:two-component system CheB/CheR fusion protein